MPFVFIVLGVGFIIIAIRGTQATAFSLLEKEFSGPNSFVKWALALFILGGVGYIPVIKPVTRALLILVLLVIILKNGTGLFAKFNSAVANPTAQQAPDAAGAGSDASASPTSGGGLSNLFSGGGGLSNLFSGGGGGLSSGNPFGSAASDASNAGTYGSSPEGSLGPAGGGLAPLYDSSGLKIGMGDPTFIEGLQYLPSGSYFGPVE